MPQQLFGFRPAPSGVWTVCYHHNNWTAPTWSSFGKSLDRYQADIWSLDEVLQIWAGRPITVLGLALHQSAFFPTADPLRTQTLGVVGLTAGASPRRG